MDIVFLISIGVVLWIALALWPAVVAKNKGYSFWLFLIASWFISFLATLIIAFILPDKTKPLPPQAPASE